MQILIVEDSEIYLTVLRETISRRYPAVGILEAGTAGRGLELARARRPALALIDIQLPDGSGLDLAAALVRELPDTMVAVCTSYDNPAYRAAARASGVAHFLPKDELSPGRIFGLVRGCLAGSAGPPTDAASPAVG